MAFEPPRCMNVMGDLNRAIRFSIGQQRTKQWQTLQGPAAQLDPRPVDDRPVRNARTTPLLQFPPQAVPTRSRYPRCQPVWKALGNVVRRSKMGGKMSACSELRAQDNGDDLVGRMR